MFCIATISGLDPADWETPMFIETEVTPNPATLKFLPGRPVMSSGTLDIRAPEGAAKSPLAQALFEIDGVGGVFFGADFISVTKTAVEWGELKPAVLGVIMEHFMSGAPLLSDGATADPLTEQDEFFAPEDAETVGTIKELIETRVRPAVAGDGGDIKFRGYRDGIVYLAMKGSCSGCPSSTATLKHGIQNLLRHYVPSVTEVEQI
jgi:Fe-S cluster biogenesis protein NfuA